MDDGIEIAAGEAARRLTVASGAVQRVGDDVVVTTIAPQTMFGPAVSGAMRLRAWRGGAPGEWQPLATLVRLPVLSAITCTERCAVAGRDLFLVAAIGPTADRAAATPLPAGFVGTSVAVPPPVDPVLYLWLHDAADVALRVTVSAR
ncbi:hypothetical protein [Sphingomonas hankookensis]|uniref:hypothetical protein n=1 Tax=Sphingomonas hankookensis TaxID=563996 RepID=UPI003D301D5C